MTTLHLSKDQIEVVCRALREIRPLTSDTSFQDRIAEVGMEIRTQQVASGRFEDALEDGILSGDPRSTVYVGHYMYMGEQNGKPAFKHRMTREYLKY